MTLYLRCMTMLSFRVDDVEAQQAQVWAERLGVDRSQLLRDALRQHLNRLASEVEAETWERHPLTDEEQSLATIAEWGPAEDWADWADATR
jgi:predicted transcriptional regulator